MAKSKIPNRDEDFEDVDQQENESDLSVSSKDFEDIVVAPADWTIGSLGISAKTELSADWAQQRQQLDLA